jgi:hypothetical protein
MCGTVLAGGVVDNRCMAGVCSGNRDYLMRHPVILVTGKNGNRGLPRNMPETVILFWLMSRRIGV